MKAWQPLIAWALSQDLVSDPPARFVLVCLAHHAKEDGTNSYPSVRTIMAYTGLGERTVRRGLRQLQDAGLIKQGPPPEATRIDRRPIRYDLQISRGACVAPRTPNGVPDRPSGVPDRQPRGACVAPDLPSDLPLTKSVVKTTWEEEYERRYGCPPGTEFPLAQQRRVRR